MRLHKRTAVWVTGRDGTSQMTLEGVFNAIKGGSKWNELEMATERKEGDANEKRRLAMRRMDELMSNMTPEQVDAAVLLVQSRDDLMELRGDRY